MKPLLKFSFPVLAMVLNIFHEGIDVGDDSPLPLYREVSFFAGDNSPVANWGIIFLPPLLAFLCLS